jgi:hypothetical protein
MEKDLQDFFGIPPKLLCKYLPPERIDVLENQRIRFTPMLETNDRFEIRRTFEVALGSKAGEHLASAFAQTDVGKIAEIVAAQMGGDASAIDHEAIRQFAIRLANEKIVPAFNTPENIEAFLMRVGGRSCALSLSDDPYNPSMWDRYASQWRGLVLYLDTGSNFFWCDERGRKIKPEKVGYRDELDAELITDMRAPLLTKLPVWSNEREWRLIVDIDNFLVSDVPDEQEALDLRLRRVPPEAFAKVLLGPDSSDELVSRCLALRATQLPHLELYRARADRFTGEMSEESIEL